MNVSAWSIRNPIPAVMLFVLLTFGGLLSFNAMKVQNFPDIDLPTVTVSAALPGAAPSQLENDVARKLENSIATVQGLKHITTKVQDGAATLIVEFRLEKPVQEAVDDVRSAVQRVRADLPADLRDPVISKLDFAAQPVLAFTIASSRMDAEGALAGSSTTTSPRSCWRVPGVGAVNRVGGVTRQVHVDLDPASCRRWAPPRPTSRASCARCRPKARAAAPTWAAASSRCARWPRCDSADELADMQIPLSDGRRIRLDQVARISDTIAEPRAAALLDGKPVVGFEVARSRGASEVEVGARDAEGAAPSCARSIPTSSSPRPSTSSTRCEEEYDGSLHLLYEGAILAVLVVWLFLRDWRATFVSAVALPMSVIPAFIGMYLLGFSINVVTLLALSLVVGILVDDAIVEVENIVRHLRMGKSPYQAAMEAADEIGLAVIATTFTLIAVFLPTAFMSGVAGKFFKQFGWTASLAVFASLVVARMLTPMMAAYILKPIVDGREGAALARHLHAHGRVEPAAPLHDHGAGHPVLLRLGGDDPAAQDRLHPARRQLADPGLPVAAPGATLAQTRRRPRRRDTPVLMPADTAQGRSLPLRLLVPLCSNRFLSSLPPSVAASIVTICSSSPSSRSRVDYTGSVATDPLDDGMGPAGMRPQR